MFFPQFAGLATRLFFAPPGKGVPTDPVVVAFLKYVLTDGQKKNEPVGYIEITHEKIRKALDLLENK